MGRKTAGATPRSKLVAFRLNAEEDRERIEKMASRGISDTSDYYRTLQKEDDGAPRS
jgi:hypothetical protein